MSECLVNKSIANDGHPDQTDNVLYEVGKSLRMTSSPLKLQQLLSLRSHHWASSYLLLTLSILFSSLLHAQDDSRFSYAFSQESDEFVQEFVGLLSAENYERALFLFDPESGTYHADEFRAMNQGFRSKIGPWKEFNKIGTSYRKVVDHASGMSMSLPAYLYRIDLEQFSTPLLLVLFMDGSVPHPSILGYDFMPKETVDLKGVLSLWRSVSRQ